MHIGTKDSDSMFIVFNNSFLGWKKHIIQMQVTHIFKTSNLSVHFAFDTYIFKKTKVNFTDHSNTAYKNNSHIKTTGD